MMAKTVRARFTMQSTPMEAPPGIQESLDLLFPLPMVNLGLESKVKSYFKRWLTNDRSIDRSLACQGVVWEREANPDQTVSDPWRGKNLRLSIKQ